MAVQVLELMKQRCSVRQYQDRRIERDKLLYVLEAARVAPSACNNQPWRFFVIEDPSLIAKIAPSWVSAALTPVLIVACGDHRLAWKRKDGKDHCDIDMAIAVDHMTLAAAEIGLGTCWICAFDAKRCAQLLNLPEHLEPVALLPIGYPAEGKSPDRHATERKPLEQIVTWMPASAG
jgi:nitroreductase